MSGFNYLKMPRNVSEYSLMRGVTDFSNLKQFDLFESGYSFLNVVSCPKFMTLLARKKVGQIENLQNGIVHIMECEFKGLDGIPDISSEPGEITNGATSIQLINNVTMDTSIQVSMEFYERSGSLISKYLEYYLTGIKDPYSKAKTYHGLIGESIFDPGPDYETFTFLYYVTDNTMRKIEKAYLLANAQPTSVPNSTLYNPQRGQHDFQTVSLQINCFPIVGDVVNKYAAMMLYNDLGTEDKSRKIVLDSRAYQYKVYEKSENTNKTNSADGATDDGFSLIGDIISNNSIKSAVEQQVNQSQNVYKPLGDQTKVSANNNNFGNGVV